MWLHNGGFYKEQPDKPGMVFCCFIDSNGESCKKHSLQKPIKLKTTNMILHLKSQHDFTEADAKERLKTSQKAGLKRFGVQLKRRALTREEQKECSYLLALALSNQLLPISLFNKNIFESNSFNSYASAVWK